jgi:RNA polymerase sigma factor (sigma-70 family)
LHNNEDNDRLLQSFQAIFDMYYDRVFKVAFYITKDRHLAQDVLQDTFLKAYHHMENIQDSNKTGAWLSVVATNTAIDLLRKRNKWNGIPTDDVLLTSMIQQFTETASVVEQEVVNSLLLQQIQAQLSKLKPEHRQAILLKYYHGLKDEEIAKLTGASSGTIKSRLHRAKKKIQSLLLIHERDERESVGESN